MFISAISPMFKANVLKAQNTASFRGDGPKSSPYDDDDDDKYSSFLYTECPEMPSARTSSVIYTTDEDGAHHKDIETTDEFGQRRKERIY